MARIGRSTRPPLPANFLFGVASADHQVEAHDVDDDDIRDTFEKQNHLTLRGRATDFYRRYSEDIALAQDLGCKAFRFSISWARVEPQPGVFAPGALKHYADLAAAVRQAGMEPVVTLHHYTWPNHVQARGGMLASEFPGWFAAYAGQVHDALRPYVRYWLTFNEPNNMIYGYIKPWWLSAYASAPGLPSDFGTQQQLSAAATLIQRLFQAHQAARDMLRVAHGDRNALVSANTYALGLPTRLFGLPINLQAWVDRNISNAKRLDEQENRWRKAGRRLVERPFLQRRDVDLVAAALTVTPERADLIDFSDVYFVTAGAVLVLQGSEYQLLGDLAGAVIGVVEGSATAALVQDGIAGARLITFGTYTAALDGLARGQVNGIASDDAILEGLMRWRPGEFRLIAGLAGRQAYAIGVTRGNRELLAGVNRALAWIRSSGLWARLYERYFGTPAPEPPPRSLGDVPLQAPKVPLQTAAALGHGREPIGAQAVNTLGADGTVLAQIQATRRLAVGVREDAPPFGYRNPTSGELEGFDVDIARAIGSFLLGDANLVNLKPISGPQRIPLLQRALAWLDPLAKSWTAVSSFVASNWFQLGELGKLPHYLCPVDCKPETDYVCFDYYYGVPSLEPWRIGALLNVIGLQFSKAPVWPAGLYDQLLYYHTLFPGKPILIAENGNVDTADGVRRAGYIDAHVAQVQRAHAAGINVIGYLVWSLTSNREWGLPFGPNSDFGLYHIALDDDPALTRRATASVQRYAEIIRQRGSVT